MTYVSKVKEKYQVTSGCPECPDYEIIAKAWAKLPKGWTMSSVKKLWNSLTGDRVHKRKACMKKMEGKVSNTGAFCNSLYHLMKDM